MRKLKPWPSYLQLRPWQRRALRRFQRIGKKDTLIVATPGSGKTMLALRIAHQLLSANPIDRVVIVCPTDHLRRQWASAAARVGIELDPNWANADGVEARDFEGVVVTYQQVSYAPDLYRLNCKRRTLVIFDEIHHAGDHLDWGSKLREAFKIAAFRLSLSGTPFRNDNIPIPFITYKEGRSCADFEYTYGEALADGVCRPVYFPSFEGRIQWLSNDGETEEHSMLTPLARLKAAERLRAALCPQGAWLRGVLLEANTKLTEFRTEGHPTAAGLVVAMDQQHAKQIGELLHIITGEEPVVAISKDPAASEKIKNFADSNARWLVSVRMASEGVDIPRLRVGVYATNVLSEMFFRQVVGRFVRMLDGLEEQSSSLFIPVDETLVRYAIQIKEERDHQLGQEMEHLAEIRGSSKCDDSNGEKAALFTPLASEYAPHDTIFDEIALLRLSWSTLSLSRADWAYASRPHRLQLYCDLARQKPAHSFYITLILQLQLIIWLTILP